MRNLIILNQNFTTNTKIDVARPQNVILMQILKKFIMADILRNNKENEKWFSLDDIGRYSFGYRKAFYGYKIKFVTLYFEFS